MKFDLEHKNSFPPKTIMVDEEAQNVKTRMAQTVPLRDLLTESNQDLIFNKNQRNNRVQLLETA